jgi:hypothetical protein
METIETKITTRGDAFIAAAEAGAEFGPNLALRDGAHQARVTSAAGIVMARHETIAASFQRRQ